VPSEFCLKGGRVLDPTGELTTKDVLVVGESIVDEAPTGSAVTLDCSDCVVLPGIVDVHGDAFEHELQPRPGVDIAFPIALGSVDRQLLGSGIKTAFHGLTLSWEPGARSLPMGRRFVASLTALRPRLVADHRVQLRWETFAHEAMADIGDWLADADLPTPAVAFNDHTTCTMEKVAAGKHEKLTQWATRAGLTPDAYLAAVETVAARADDVAGDIRAVAALASRHGAIMLSHDERTQSERHHNRALGMTVCEFPLSREVARDAVGHGEHTVLGGPNVIRGGSHTGAMSAEEAIASGLCTVLASDYYYPSLLHAVERLVKRGVLSLEAAWPLVSSNPAQAMGLMDRGTIEPGYRADLVVVNTTHAWQIVHTIAAGRLTTFAAAL